MALRTLVPTARSDVWNNVCARVAKSLPNACVVHIDEVNNHPGVETAYLSYKEALGTVGQEVWVWHGTALENVDSICDEGFKPERNKRSAYGHGTYYAEKCEHSLTGFAPKADTDLCYVFLCKLTYTLRKQQPTNFGEIGGSGIIYCAPHAYQALPVYVVAFFR